jgi:hypothetical protein
MIIRRRRLILISCSTQFYLFSDCNFSIWIVKNKCQIYKLQLFGDTKVSKGTTVPSLRLTLKVWIISLIAHRLLFSRVKIWAYHVLHSFWYSNGTFRYHMGHLGSVRIWPIDLTGISLVTCEFVTQNWFD